MLLPDTVQVFAVQLAKLDDISLLGCDRLFVLVLLTASRLAATVTSNYLLVARDRLGDFMQNSS